MSADTFADAVAGGVGVVLMAIGVVLVGLAFMDGINYAVFGSQALHEPVILASLGSFPLTVGGFLLLAATED